MPHRRFAVVLLVCITLFAPVLLAGCRTTIVHAPTGLSDPVPIFIADYGKHSSLVLPRDDGTLVEWAYGEWDWFAAGKTGFWRIPGVMLGDHPGALGRRELGDSGSDTDAQTLVAAMRLESAHRVDVERSKAAALVTKLDEAAAAGAPHALFNPENSLIFVPDPRPYSMSFHCNTVTAQWLRELGCDVGDAGFVAEFEILPAATPQQATPPAPRQ